MAEPALRAGFPATGVQPTTPALNGGAPTAGARPLRTSVDQLHSHLDEDAQLRLGLQRRAQRNLRRHAERAAVRLAVLVAGDAGAFLFMRGLIRAARDHAILGSGLAGTLTTVLPRGYMQGLQFSSALILALLVTGSYGQGDRRRDPIRLFSACAIAAALPLWVGMWSSGFAIFLLQFILTAFLVWIGVFAERLTIDRIVALVRSPESNAARTLFVGPGFLCRTAISKPVFSTTMDYKVVGFVDIAEQRSAGALGGLDELPSVIHQENIEAVVMCGQMRERTFERVIDGALAGGCEILSLPRSLHTSGMRPTLVWRSGEPFIRLTAPSLMAQALFIKRIVDILAGVAGLLLLSPLLAALAFLVRLDTHGPILFRQQRVGLGGRPFGMLKFRTMVVGADASKEDVAHLNRSGDKRLFKIPNDPRVTRTGRWLRRWSLDELPQLWNVLVGDMSLVGPRPFFGSDLVHYEAHHFDRLGAKPGITGLWQVSGRSSIVDFEEVVRLDREYIETWSFGLDLKILLRTLPAVLMRKGAF